LQGGVFIGLVAFAAVMVEVQVEFEDREDWEFSVGVVFWMEHVRHGCWIEI